MKIQVRFLVNIPEQFGGLTIVPWAMYRLPEEMLSRIPVQYEEVPVNLSRMRVGTRLAQIIRWARLSKLSCSSCQMLQTTLDIADIRWIETHVNEITEGILENARQLGVTVQKWKVKFGLRLAIRIERAMW